MNRTIRNNSAIPFVLGLLFCCVQFFAVYVHSHKETVLSGKTTDKVFTDSHTESAAHHCLGCAQWALSGIAETNFVSCVIWSPDFSYKQPECSLMPSRFTAFYSHSLRAPPAAV